MKIRRHIVLRLVGGLIGMAAVLTVGITVFVYSGREHLEAVTSIAREFFAVVERAARTKRAPESALASPTPEGGAIQ